jgi:hypothetical protein
VREIRTLRCDVAGAGNVARLKGLPARQSSTLLTRGAYGNVSYGKG